MGAQSPDELPNIDDNVIPVLIRPDDKAEEIRAYLREVREFLIEKYPTGSRPLPVSNNADIKRWIVYPDGEIFMDHYRKIDEDDIRHHMLNTKGVTKVWLSRLFHGSASQRAVLDALKENTTVRSVD